MAIKMETENSTDILFILGSSRKEGNTHFITHWLAQQLDGEVIDLSEKDISYYDYDHNNAEDDFLEIAEQMTRSRLVVLCSPVYWYTLSAQMKVFLDRWSDLLTIRKDLGRKLKGIKLGLISCGSWEESSPSYDEPVKLSAQYMDMDYSGYFHTWIADSENKESAVVSERLRIIKEELIRI